MRLIERLIALERSALGTDAKPLPLVVPDSTTDAEIDASRRRGIDVYRESDPTFIDCFVGP